jgi:hypothetical protein
MDKNIPTGRLKAHPNVHSALLAFPTFFALGGAFGSLSMRSLVEYQKSNFRWKYLRIYDKCDTALSVAEKMAISAQTSGIGDIG